MLQSGLQVIVQCRHDETDTSLQSLVSCDGYGGTMLSVPVLISIAGQPSTQPSGSSHVQTATLLHTAVMRLLHSWSGLHAQVVPCPPSRPASGCHAFKDSECRKLLVYVCDGQSTVDPKVDALLEWWMKMAAQDERWSVLPVWPVRWQRAISALLPSTLRTRQISQWTNSITESAMDVLFAAGLDTEERRIFISYIRKDTIELAEDLALELTKHNVRVFLDHFCIPVTTDFQERLSQELSDKGYLLLLESPNIQQSAWVRHEINFAIRHRMGLCALQMPGAPLVPWVSAAARYSATTREISSGPYRLTSAGAQSIVQHVLEDHGRALARRRWELTLNLLKGLHGIGCTNARVRGAGLDAVGVSGRAYRVRTTARSAELRDFHRLAQDCPVKGPSGVLVSASPAIEYARRAELQWLSDGVKIHLDNAGRLRTLIRRLAQGTLP